MTDDRTYLGRSLDMWDSLLRGGTSNTEQAMRIGAVHGYRGLIRELIGELKRELRVKNLPVVATGVLTGVLATVLCGVGAAGLAGLALWTGLRAAV